MGFALRRNVSLCVLAALVVVSALASPVLASPQDDKARNDAELARTRATLEAATGRAQDAASAYLQATAALPAAQMALAEARGRVAAAQVAERQAQRQYAAAMTVYDNATAEYDKATAEVEAARERVGSFVSAAYKGSGLAMLDSVLAATSPLDLAQRIGYLDHVAADERRAVNELSTLRSVAKDKQNIAEVARQQAERARAAAVQALAAGQAAEAQAEQAAGDVQQLIDARASASAVAEQERSAVLTRYEELQAESARIAEELRRQAGLRPAPVEVRPGPLLMPARGYKSSDFGMRYDPYYNVWQLHAGVDIAASGGQGIVAAADGTVVYAGWNGGYGNYTCISHGSNQGRNLATCYAHQSQILVSVGQWVSRGGLIGRVGTTGASTGNHLHFEVRLNGEPVNPLPWLPGCLC
jgi:murein DD-endopeptidase MepM/ murein hydrolase activator NlpD